ncbi:hypothetical protein CerSpe_147040 [Prunus speciosa]
MTGTGATRPPAIPPSKYYLVKSSQGDLLLSLKIPTIDVRLTRYFVLFGDDGGLQWAEIESIGTDALFLSLYQSMSVYALDFQECRPDSIYIDHVNI